MQKKFKNLVTPITNKKVFILFFVVGITIFLNGLFNGFIGDDFPQIVDKENILTIESIPKYFSESISFSNNKPSLFGSSYKPIFTSVYAILNTIFGPAPFVFHAFQIALYIINSLLVYMFLKSFFKKEIASILSLIFLVHPMNSESAFYIAGTQDVLFFFFGMMGIIILEKYNSKKGLFFGGLFLLCSLLAKETGILFLLLSLVLVLLRQKRPFQYILVNFSFLSFIYFVLRIKASNTFIHSIVLTPIQKTDLLIRLLNIPAVLYFYLKTFLFPNDLSMSHLWVHTNIDFGNFILPLIIDVIFLLLIIYPFYLLREKKNLFKNYIFFFVWLLAGIILHLQLVPLDGTVAERWFYFPMIGLLGMIGVLTTYFKINLKSKKLIFGIVTIIILLSIRTFIRSFDWRNDFTIATHDLKVSKEAYNLEDELTFYYFTKKDYRAVKLHAQNSIKIYPGVVGYNNLGAANFFLGNFKDSMNAYKKSLSLGDYQLTYDNLSSLYLVYGDKKEGIEFVKNALKKYPKDITLRTNLSRLERKHEGNQSARKRRY